MSNFKNNKLLWLGLIIWIILIAFGFNYHFFLGLIMTLLPVIIASFWR